MIFVCFIFFLSGYTFATNFISASNELIQYRGRTFKSGDNMQFDWSGTTIVTKVSGKFLSIRLSSNYWQTDQPQIDVFVDKAYQGRLNLTSTATDYVLVKRTTESVFDVILAKSTEAAGGITTVFGFHTDGEMQSPPLPPSRRIEFIGDSITVGYGCDGVPPCDDPPSWSMSYEDNYHAWGSVMARSLQAEARTVAWSGRGLCAGWDTPFGQDNNTAPLYYKRVLGSVYDSIWNFSQWIPDAVVIKLGCNDFNPSNPPRPTEEQWMDTFVSFAHTITLNYQKTDIPIFGACGPLCNSTCNTVKQAIDLAKSKNINAYFLDQQIYYPPSHQGCQDHPNVIGHASIATVSLPQVKKVLGW